MYTPPSGWVELLQSADGRGADRHRFHMSRGCPRIRCSPEALVAVDRPYSAARCTGCADVYESVAPPAAGGPP